MRFHFTWKISINVITCMITYFTWKININVITGKPKTLPRYRHPPLTKMLSVIWVSLTGIYPSFQISIGSISFCSIFDLNCSVQIGSIKHTQEFFFQFKSVWIFHLFIFWNPERNLNERWLSAGYPGSHFLGELFPSHVLGRSTIMNGQHTDTLSHLPVNARLSGTYRHRSP